MSIENTGQLEVKTKQEVEFNPERVDRLFEVRYQNAVVLSQIEIMLSKRVALPDKFTSIGETGYVSLLEDVKVKMNY